MTAALFVIVVCLLALKATLVAASTTQTLRAALMSAVGQRLRRLPSRYGLIGSVGIVMAWIGWISDKSWAAPVLAIGLVLMQVSVFRAGVQWERGRRLSASKPASPRFWRDRTNSAPRPVAS